MRRRAIILGAGFTGRRVAALLADRGWQVKATTRSPRNLADLRDNGVDVLGLDVARDPLAPIPADGASVLLSIPTLRSEDALDEPTPRLLASLSGCPEHLTYLSTTGVYGRIREVNETTPAAPETERQRLRLVAERSVLAHQCPALVLRVAAIYGPGRGVHAAMREGRFQLSNAQPRYVSRIHVDDLAQIVARSMEQGLSGTFPVADELPAPSGEVASFCSEHLGLEMPGRVPDQVLTETRRSDRKVDGRAVLQALRLRLHYPTYREGILASVAEESPLDRQAPAARLGEQAARGGTDAA